MIIITALLLLAAFGMFLFFVMPGAAFQISPHMWGLAIMFGADPEGDWVLHFQLGPFTVFRLTPYLAKELGVEDDEDDATFV